MTEPMTSTENTTPELLLTTLIAIQAYHNSELRKERKMPDHAFVPFKIRCCFPKG
jgi:hypothetical protein